MHVAVTGAAGFIGSHVVEHLATAGHRVTGLDSFDAYLYPSTRKRENAATLERLPGFRLVTGDICDPSAVTAAITPDVDIVCHLAALAGVRPSLADPQRYLQTNIVGTGVILERMRALGKQRMVFASSSSVYGKRPAQGPAFLETDPCLRPASPYAASKRMNELQLSTYSELWGLGVFALRFFTVFGPRQRPDMAISKFLTAVSADRPITMFGDGSSRRDYTFVDDIVSGVAAAIERVEPDCYELINLGGTRTTSLRDMISCVEKIVGKRALIEQKADEPGDVPLTFADIDKARRLLAYSPTTSLVEGIAKQWSWQKASSS